MFSYSVKLSTVAKSLLEFFIRKNSLKWTITTFYFKNILQCSYFLFLSYLAMILHKTVFIILITALMTL